MEDKTEGVQIAFATLLDATGSTPTRTEVEEAEILQEEIARRKRRDSVGFLLLDKKSNRLQAQKLRNQYVQNEFQLKHHISLQNAKSNTAFNNALQSYSLNPDEKNASFPIIHSLHVAGQGRYRFRNVPPRIFSFPTLHHLSLQGHCLGAGEVGGGGRGGDAPILGVGGGIPSSLASLAFSLTHFVCVSNRLTSVPKEVGSLANLIHLDLSDNSITTLPPLRKLKELVSLVVQNNQLTSLPSDLPSLPSLETLLCGYNQIEELPHNFEFLASTLKFLDLSNNPLRPTKQGSDIPTCLFAITKLEQLAISGSKCDSVDSLQVFRMCLDLDLSRNSLRSLPEDIDALGKVTRLDVSRNSLGALPSSLEELDKLRYFFAHHNQIETLPLTSPSSPLLCSPLVTLDLSHNKLSDSGQLKLLASSPTLQASLKALHLNNNNFSSIPSELSYLSSLELLDLASNNLSVLPLDLFPPSLNDESPSSLFFSLKHLYLANNSLETLPPTFSHLPSLSHLDLTNNPLSSLPPSFSLLTSLRYLKMVNFNSKENFQEKDLFEPITFPPYLEKLKILGIEIKSENDSCRVLPSFPLAQGNRSALNYSKLAASPRSINNSPPPSLRRPPAPVPPSPSPNGSNAPPPPRPRRVTSPSPDSQSGPSIPPRPTSPEAAPLGSPLPPSTPPSSLRTPSPPPSPPTSPSQPPAFFTHSPLPASSSSPSSPFTSRISFPSFPFSTPSSPSVPPQTRVPNQKREQLEKEYIFSSLTFLTCCCPHPLFLKALHKLSEEPANCSQLAQIGGVEAMLSVMDTSLNNKDFFLGYLASRILTNLIEHDETSLTPPQFSRLISFAFPPPNSPPPSFTSSYPYQLNPEICKSILSVIGTFIIQLNIAKFRLDAYEGKVEGEGGYDGPENIPSPKRKEPEFSPTASSSSMPPSSRSPSMVSSPNFPAGPLLSPCIPSFFTSSLFPSPCWSALSRDDLLQLVDLIQMIDSEKLSEYLRDQNKETAGEAKRLMVLKGDHIELLKYKREIKGEQGKGIRVLALDGGGIRALITLRLLGELEEITGKKITDLFDVVACTSTGSLLATLVFVRKLDLKTSAELYKKFGRKCFASQTGDKDATRGDSNWSKFMNYVNWMSQGGVYKTEDFLLSLEEVCGSDKMVDLTRDLDVPWIFYTSSTVSVNPPRPFLYRNYNPCPARPSRYNGVSFMNTHQALRSTTSAPGYFEEFTSPLLPLQRQADGGLLHNNPSGLAVHECLRMFGKDQKIEVVINLGTGRFPVRTETATGIKGVMNALVKSAASSEKVSEVLDDVLELCGSAHYRLNPTNEVFDCGLLELRQEVLDAMDNEMTNYLKENRGLMEEICGLLS